jgi:DNA-binding MarR family transcriptional regulator
MSADDVDAIVESWHRERPDLDVQPLAVLSRVTRLARHLDQARAEAFDLHDLDSWEFDVLAALRRSGAPYALSPGQLASETMVTSGTMTNRVDRLTERGFVQRTPDPNDRRGVRVELTDAGKRAVDGALTDLLKREHTLLDSLDTRQRADLADLLRTLMVQFKNS